MESGVCSPWRGGMGSGGKFLMEIERLIRPNCSEWDTEVDSEEDTGYVLAKMADNYRIAEEIRKEAKNKDWD